MNVKEEGIKQFFEYSRERHNVYLCRKANDPYPWTPDPILNEFRFCNIYRELDTTTIWFRENVRQELYSSPEVLFATIAFRWFNKIETGKLIKDALLAGAAAWDQVKIFNTLQNQKPVVTGSYIIKTPDGMTKLKGVLWCIEQIRNDCMDLACAIDDEVGMEDVWEKLREFPYLGDFMSYEIVTDLRYTGLLADAKDKYTWANPGPGAARGYGRILGRGPEYLNRSSKADRKVLIEGMQELMQLAGDWGFDGSADCPLWEMRESEHTLCEFDKYMRVKNGEGRPRQIYRRPA